MKASAPKAEGSIIITFTAVWSWGKCWLNQKVNPMIHLEGGRKKVISFQPLGIMKTCTRNFVTVTPLVPSWDVSVCTTRHAELKLKTLKLTWIFPAACENVHQKSVPFPTALHKQAHKRVQRRRWGEFHTQPRPVLRADDILDSHNKTQLHLRGLCQSEHCITAAPTHQHHRHESPKPHNPSLWFSSDISWQCKLASVYWCVRRAALLLITFTLDRWL